MQPLSLDTSAEAQEILFAMLREAPPARKLSLTLQLIQNTRLLTLPGLRRRLSHLPEAEIERRFIAKILTREHVVSAYGFDPDSLG